MLKMAPPRPAPPPPPLTLLAPPPKPPEPTPVPDELGWLGDYRVLKVLGSGGMGVVFLAEDVRLRRQVAVKAMKPGLAANAKARERFLREAQLTASITHDHVIAVHQVGEEKGAPFLAMPLLQGESLESQLKRPGRLPLANVLRIGRETAEGLAAAHAHGLIHRDVKPANLWLETLPGERYRVKVLDFGLARAAEGDDVHLTQTGVVVGTPAYMAPEQARGEKVDARGDLFSLGCVLYKLLTGQTPFAGDTAMAILMSLALDHPKPIRDFNPDVPAELSDLVMRLLEKEPARRPASAGEVVHALEGVERRLARQEPPDATVALATTPPRRRRLALIVAAAVVVGLVGVGTAALIRISTGQGDYVIEADDADFSFVVHDGAVHMEDHKTDKKYTLKVVRQDKDAKEVEMDVNDGGDLSFKTKTFTIKRGKKAVPVHFGPASFP
jgi:serine/threonine protein kinase